MTGTSTRHGFGLVNGLVNGLVAHLINFVHCGYCMSHSFLSTRFVSVDKLYSLSNESLKAYHLELTMAKRNLFHDNFLSSVTVIMQSAGARGSSG